VTGSCEHGDEPSGSGATEIDAKTQMLIRSYPISSKMTTQINI
jgi:hypothetical protein